MVEVVDILMLTDFLNLLKDIMAALFELNRAVLTGNCVLSVNFDCLRKSTILSMENRLMNLWISNLLPPYKPRIMRKENSSSHDHFFPVT